MVIEIRKNTPPKPSLKEATNPLWQHKDIQKPASKEDTAAFIKQAIDERGKTNVMIEEEGKAFVARQIAEEQRQLQAVHDRFFAAFQNEERRKIYNAAYQRDLRTIKRLGLNCTVAQYRESLK
jgi:hypothetical protein